MPGKQGFKNREQKTVIGDQRTENGDQRPDIGERRPGIGRRMGNNSKQPAASGQLPTGSLPWLLYILRCADNSLYTGVTNDLPRRIATHREGKGAKYVSGRLPVEIVYTEGPFADRGTAQSREYSVKKMSRMAKEKLIQTNACPEKK